MPSGNLSTFVPDAVNDDLNQVWNILLTETFE